MNYEKTTFQGLKAYRVGNDTISDTLSEVKIFTKGCTRTAVFCDRFLGCVGDIDGPFQGSLNEISKKNITHVYPAFYDWDLNLIRLGAREVPKHISGSKTEMQKGMVCFSKVSRLIQGGPFNIKEVVAFMESDMGKRDDLVFAEAKVNQGLILNGIKNLPVDQLSLV
ncbi:hypothetical protein [Vibrio barjaei]|uniref:hypothetical protein n=1 Tax=Vibrio barjaei TaxID=1676683 RepID=UPI002283F8A0|nr:hypothetical protein [Vibrio barjaei]MCY9873842.1 hypothetical protein [Vibrio barjaei]